MPTKRIVERTREMTKLEQLLRQPEVTAKTKEFARHMLGIKPRRVVKRRKDNL